ncbi:MAG: ABC transporter permease [Deltaproteobacteria bacterium]|nr:ABC transporter permease [Deltaproteobacteria bacterium]
MNGLRPLIRKELTEHRTRFLLVALVFHAFAMLQGFAEARSGLSGAVAFRAPLVIGAPLCAFMAVQVIVSQEFSRRTQLFLEALPVTRAEIALSKFIVSAVFAYGTIVLGFLLTMTLSGRPAPTLIHVAGPTLFRVLAWVVTSHGFFFLLSTLGRYRFLVFGLGYLALVSLFELTDLEPLATPPFSVLDGRFGTETSVAWGDILETCGIGWAFGGLAFLVLLVREGAIATRLSEPMSDREKLAATAVSVVALVGLVSVIKHTKTIPFDLPNAVIEQSPGITIKLLPSDDRAADERLLADIRLRLEAARRYLEIDALPPVFLVRSPDLDPGTAQTGKLADASGVVLRFREASTPVGQARLQAAIIRQALLVLTNERACLEANRWILDGFGLFAMAQLASDTHSDEALSQVLRLRALYATKVGFERADLDRWLSLRERLGEEVADGLAADLLSNLHARYGKEKLGTWLRAHLGTPYPRDIRALWLTPHFSDAFARSIGVSFDEAFENWRHGLTPKVGSDEEARLASIPKIDGTVSMRPIGKETRRIEIQLSEPTRRGASSPVEFRYARIEPINAELDPASLRTEYLEPMRPANTPETTAPETTAPETTAPVATAQVFETFVRGARIAWTFSMPVDALACDVISGWKRETIP